MRKSKSEEFGSHKARLFPELHNKISGLENTKILTRTVTFQVTDACNLACTYCYQINKGTRRMSFETAKKFIDYLLQTDINDHYINPQISPFLILDFIGGEPLLEINLIDKIIDYFMEKCFELQHPWATRFCASICTNGVLYNTPDVQRFLRKHQNHLSLNVTLDGDKELHDSCRIFPDGKGSYDLAVAAALDWLKRGRMSSKITIAPGNVNHVYKALRHMIELGYTDINANCVFEEGWTIEHAQELYKEMKKFSDYLLDNNIEDLYCSFWESDFFTPKSLEDNDNWCGGTGSMIAVDPDGWIYPCIRYMESSLGEEQKPIRIGHVDWGIEKLEKEKQTVKCLDCINRRTQSTDKCYYCPIAEGCAWCSGYNYQIFGTPDKRATYICIMHQARALINIYYWNKFYRKNNKEKRMLCYVPKEWAIPIIGEEEYNMLIELSGGTPGVNPYQEEFEKGCIEEENKVEA